MCKICDKWKDCYFKLLVRTTNEINHFKNETVIAASQCNRLIQQNHRLTKRIQLLESKIEKKSSK